MVTNKNISLIQNIIRYPKKSNEFMKFMQKIATFKQNNIICHLVCLAINQYCEKGIMKKYFEFKTYHE